MFLDTSGNYMQETENQGVGSSILPWANTPSSAVISIPSDVPVVIMTNRSRWVRTFNIRVPNQTRVLFRPARRSADSTTITARLEAARDGSGTIPGEKSIA